MHGLLAALLYHSQELATSHAYILDAKHFGDDAIIECLHPGNQLLNGLDHGREDGGRIDGARSAVRIELADEVRIDFGDVLSDEAHVSRSALV